MKKETISLEKTGLFSNLICDFINNDDQFKKHSSINIASVLDKIKKKKFLYRDVLTKTLKKQYRKTLFHKVDLSKVKYNLSQLSSEQSFTITTGHQLNIFANPLFLIYKITTVIAYVNFLNKKITDYYFIPCFWMATEDHDFQEIQGFNFYNKDYTVTANNEDAVGNLSSDFVLENLSKIQEELMSTEYGVELYHIYKQAYSQNVNYADATRSLLTSLFGDYGLVVIDGNHRDLKKIFSHDMKDDVIQEYVYIEMLKYIQSTQKKYKPEVNAMRYNIFYLYAGKRYKIKFNGEQYVTLNKQWSKEKLLEEISQFPERFSPNVILRTLYQEHIMPNIMYIGGPSEIAYWLQCQDLFDVRKIDYPFLALRSHFLFLSKKASKIKLKLDLSNIYLFRTYEEKVKHIIRKFKLLNIDTHLNKLNQLLLDIEKEIRTKDHRVLDSFFVFEKRISNEINRLNTKIIKFEKTKHEVILQKIRTLNDEVFPSKNIQERVISFMPYYIKYGKSFFNLLIQESSIFVNKYTILTEEDDINII